MENEPNRRHISQSVLTTPGIAHKALGEPNRRLQYTDDIEIVMLSGTVRTK